MTLFSAIVILLKKRLRDSLRLCYVMLLSVIAVFVIYPRSLSLMLPASTGDVTSVTGYYNHPYSFDLSVANKRFFMGTIGFYIDFNIPALISFVGTIAFISCIIILLVFLFRNEKWMISLRSKTRNRITGLFRLIGHFFRKLDISMIVAVLSCVFFLVIIPLSASLTNMGYTERYFFSAMSLFVVFYISFLGRIILELTESLNKKKIAIPILISIIVLTVISCFRSHTLTDMFRFAEMHESDLKNNLNGEDCYVLVHAQRDLVILLVEVNHLRLDEDSPLGVAAFREGYKKLKEARN